MRVFQDFATLDLLSGGRAEIMAGRGSFIESFPLFGYDLDDYDELFAEKLELLLELRDAERVTWSGTHRAPLDDLGVYPRPLQEPLPVWIAVGGTPAVGRARRHARPADGARDHRRPARALRAVRRALPRAPRPRRATMPPPPLSINSHGYVAGHLASRRRDEFFPPYAGDDEPHRPRARLVADDARRTSTRCARSRGALLVGSPERGDREDPLPARDLRPPALPRCR